MYYIYFSLGQLPYVMNPTTHEFQISVGIIWKTEDTENSQVSCNKVIALRGSTPKREVSCLFEIQSFYEMQRHTMQHHTKTCNLIKCLAMQCHATPRNTMQCKPMPCHAMPCPVMPRHGMPCNAKYHAMQSNAMPCNAMQHNAMQSNAMACNVMQHHVMQS